MFVGRERELQALRRLYDQGRFQMVVVYGRRRVGKTTLVGEFIRDKRAIAFTAQEQSSAENLRGFSNAVYEGLGLPSGMGAFQTWSDAFTFLAKQSMTISEPLVVFFDEFPYAAEGEPSLPSTLQAAIDHELLGTRVYLVLCGSNEGFMESEVLGGKSPLYGRRTAQIHLRPFDYLDASRMLSGLSPHELVRTYAAFGGTPYYLAQYDQTDSWENNVAALMYDTAGLLYEEPAMLLRQELREPALYNSVLAAIARGATKPKAIAETAGISQASVGPYLKTLEGLGIIERRVPFGDDPAKSRKGIWIVSDPFFAFWHRFVRPRISAIEMGAGKFVAREMASSVDLPTYEGKRFEDICMQWVARTNRAEALPFLATSFGQWWGTDPALRETCDIDVVAANKDRRSIMLGECKWRNEFDESAAIATLERRSEFVRGVWEERVYVLFSKWRASRGTAAKANARGDVLLVSAEDMLEV